MILGVFSTSSLRSWPWRCVRCWPDAGHFTAIGQWAANASTQVLAALGVGGCLPEESTIRRALHNLDGDELDTAIGWWAAGRTDPGRTRRRVAVDGKRVGGSGGDAIKPRHLLAAIDHAQGVVLA